MSRRPTGSVRSYRGGWIGDIQFNRRRQRRCFREKPDAETWLAAAMEAIRSNMVPLTPGEMASVREVAALLPADTTLYEAVRYYRDHQEAPPSTETLAQACQAYLEDKRAAGLRPASLRNVRHYVGRFVEAQPRQIVAAVTTADLLDYLRLRKTSPAHRDDYRRAWSTFFAWCVRRRKMLHNPADGLTPLRQQENTVHIYSAKQADSLLRAAAKHQPRMVPFLAIGLFAGVRASELDGLAWNDVDLEAGVIRVLPETAKARRQRLVSIQPNLAAWIRSHPHGRGPVVPVSPKYRHRDLRKVHAQAKVRRVVNGLRHSFATYHYARWKDIARTAAELGHTGGVDVLLRHYRALATEKEARAFFAITPATKKRSHA